MKFLIVACSALLSFLAFGTIALSQPLYSSCLSEDQKVTVELTAQSSDEDSMIDLKIKSNDKNRPAEATFPTQENIFEETVSYTLLESEFEILNVEKATGKGQLSKGQPGGPSPTVTVICSQ